MHCPFEVEMELLSARRQAIEEVAKLAMDERFGLCPWSTGMYVPNSVHHGVSLIQQDLYILHSCLQDECVPRTASGTCNCSLSCTPSFAVPGLRPPAVDSHPDDKAVAFGEGCLRQRCIVSRARCACGD